MVIFNSKQLEELENIHDSTGSFEEESEDGSSSNSDDNSEGAMEWRRGLIEEAAEHVKRAMTRPVDPQITYEIGSMLFDRDSPRYGRVARSIPGYLKIDFLSGGDRELGIFNLADYLVEFGASKKASELGKQLGMTNAEVLDELASHGIEPLPESEEDIAAAEKAEKAAAANAKKSKPAEKATKAASKPAEPKKAAKPASKAANKKKPASKKKAAAKGGASKRGKGGKSDPIDDPNGYIKQNYMTMSNRELARETGLSEHTIRRKLGEWSLRRKKR